jgi:hypothetical protein
MLEFLIDNIFVVVGEQVIQQSVGISMGTNCTPLLADLLLYSYSAEFMQKLLQEKKRSLAVPLNWTFRYIDDVLSIKYDISIHMLTLYIHRGLKFINKVNKM